MITLNFHKLYKDERKNEPCFIAIPVEKGELKDTNQVYITDGKNNVPIQCKVTSRWEDGSIRWLFIRFLADLPANDKKEYYCDWQTQPQEIPLTQLVVSHDDNRTTVDTGALQFSVANHTKTLFEEISFKAREYLGSNLIGPILKDGNQDEYDMFIDQWHIIEAGSVCVVLKAKGCHIAKADHKISFEVTLTAYVGKPWVEVAYRIINTTTNPLHIAALEMKFQPNNKEGKVQTCVGVSNYKTQYQIGKNGEKVEQIIDANKLVYESNEHISEVFYGTLFADYMDQVGGLCATIYQAQQNYPKAVYADEEGLHIKLVPEDVNKVVMQAGMAREQKVLLHFHDSSETLEELNNRSIIYQMPDRPTIKPEVYRDAKVFEDVFVDKKNHLVEMMLIQKADSHSRCYGMLNWGDSPDPGYTSQGRGNGALVWTNNEYDFPHACALLYARTETRRFLDYVLVAGRHWMDVDICHYSNNPLLQDGQWEHTNGHCINGKIVCSHQWVEGLLDYYHFTGDEEAYRLAIGIGHNIQRLLETPMFQNTGEINARETGWALRSLVALYKETYDESWLEKCDWIVGHFIQWENKYGHWLSPYTDNTEVRVPFMISIAVGSLMRYYRIRPQQHIKEMMLRAIDDLIENALLENGTFYYKELPSLQRLSNNTIILEALTIGYELTGDIKYLQVGLETFKVCINRLDVGMSFNKEIWEDAVVTKGPGTKNFAQSFWPLTTFYKASTDNDLLSIKVSEIL